jgi:ATP-binding cassette subfamily B protein
VTSLSTPKLVQRLTREARRRRSYFGEAISTVVAADRRGASYAFVLQFLGAAASLGLVLAGHFALTAVLHGDADAGSLVAALVLLALATSLSASAGALQALQQRLLTERVAQAIWQRFLSSTAGVDLLAYESSDFVHRLDRVRANAASRPVSVVTSSLGLTASVITIGMVSIPVMALEPLILPVLLISGLPVVAIARRISTTEFEFVSRTGPLNQRRGYLRALLTMRTTAAEIRAFEAAPELLRRQAANDAEYLADLDDHVRLRRRLTLLSLLASAAGLAVALGLIVAFLVGGRLSVPDAGAAVIATRILGGQLTSAFRSFGSLVESGPFLEDVADFFVRYPPTTVQGHARELHAELRVEDVTFAYPGQSRPALSDVSLVVPRGAVVALVGENGSGKTTLAKVIGGLFEPGTGRVTWDGARLPAQDLRASCSVLLQEHLRYLMSVGENVAISNTRRPMDRGRVLHELDRVGLAGPVNALPRGIDTVLGMELDEGSDFSGGQWQRLALARALYRDASLLILDEPSAALDPRAEYELFQDVRTLLDGRSAILISHRYSSVRLADLVVVMDEGRIVEYGDHRTLMAEGGRYAELYRLQAESYAESPPLLGPAT